MSFTVGQLLSALQDLPPDDLVIMAKDTEGNSYSPLDEVDLDAGYEAESTWSGVVHPGYACDGHSIIACVVLRPSN